MVVLENKREYQIIREGNDDVLRVDASSWPYAPSIEENPLVMARVIDYLVENPSIARVVLNQRRTFSYDEKQTLYLLEIAAFYEHLTKQKKLFNLGEFASNPLFANKSAELQYLVYNLLRTDPLGAYVEAKRLLRESLISVRRGTNDEATNVYLLSLEYFRDNLARTRMIKILKDDLDGYRIGNRDLYKELFRPLITPHFMDTRLMQDIPLDGIFISGYAVGDSSVSIIQTNNAIKLHYHIVPSEL